MDATDIRTHHDVTGRAQRAAIAAFLNRGQRTAIAILNGRPPSSATSPGLASLIVVLRVIYAYLLTQPGALPFLDWVKSEEKQNTILRAAWHPFGDEPEEIKLATRSMNKWVEDLRSKGFSPNESFYTLCESSLMKNTFWSHPGIRVVRPPAQVESSNAAGSYLHADLLEFRPAQKPGQTLQAFADDLFETTTARPPIIRLLYHSDEKQPIDFKDLRSFRPPVSSDAAHGMQKTYMVLAIVRLNDKSHKNDYVRTYSIDGPNLIAEYEPPSFMAHRWSVRDAPVKYMLIYGLHESWSHNLPDLASLPEIATYPVSKAQISFLRGVHDDLKGMLTLKAAEADSAAAAGDTQQSETEYKDSRISSDGTYFRKAAWKVKENSPGYGSDRPYRE
ncbi:uncharacterized protein FPRO_10332 [Fusarium proliferatum ET1]|uniref:Uncharacterized protein n=1 Tax=Fusarium proliferatum (strain ET1) TaxID=1227346 RepID=A0A1L7VJY5_FUSPR|nr:uncharacterized protein FPRO_10332 [Fusarium proliferatum ET1]CZR40744.1 uncharacterized protein FPRO_10332 [Fusarium proliferatum ET1]